MNSLHTLSFILKWRSFEEVVGCYFESLCDVEDDNQP